MEMKNSRLLKEGLYYISREEALEMLPLLREEATSIEVECPESYDSTLIFHLPGGIWVSISNPSEAAFEASGFWGYSKS